MKAPVVTVLGRYPGMFAPVFSPCQMTVEFFEDEAFNVSIRLEDKENPDFFLQLRFDSVWDLVRYVLTATVEHEACECQESWEELTPVKSRLVEAMVYEVRKMMTTQWIKKFLRDERSNT